MMTEAAELTRQFNLGFMIGAAGMSVVWLCGLYWAFDQLDHRERVAKYWKHEAGNLKRALNGNPIGLPNPYRDAVKGQGGE